MIKKETVLSNIKKNTFPKKHFSNSKIETITQSYLTQVVYWLDPSALVYQYGSFRLEADPQVSVYENMAVDNYTKECYPPIAFLERFYGYTFPQALYLLNHFYYKVLKTPLQTALEDLKGVPSASSSRLRAVADKEAVDLGGILAEDKLGQGNAEALRRAYAYLVNTRGLERNVVENFITQGYLKMDDHNNLCFITYADPLEKANVTAVTVKGTTGKRFNQNKVAVPNTGFFYAPKPMLEANAYEEAFVFESVIDLMAYLSLLWTGRITEGEGHADNRCYIALNGLGNRDYLTGLVMRHSTIKTVSLCLDNDQRGMEGAARLKARFSCLCAVHDLRETGLKPISAAFGYCKDWGDVVRLPAHDLGTIG